MVKFNKYDSKILSQIGLNAGEVAFASLFTSIFVDKGKISLVLLSLVLTLIFWGSSWFFVKRYKL